MALDLKNIKSIVGLSGKTFKAVQTKAGKVLWKAGAIVTYVVDTTAAYTEEVDTGASCLAPTTFNPSKSGWTFVGWRKDSTASSSVETSVVMEGEPITLYAVFKKTVTLTYYDADYGKNTATRQAYYNNSNVVKAAFENFTQTAMTGWISSGWSASSEGNPTIAFRDGATISIDSDLTIYGCYKQQITVTYYNNSTSASTAKDTRYYNASGNYVNPSFTLTQATKSGWSARGWSTSNAGNATVTYNNATAFTRASNITLYGMYQQTITLSYAGNSNTGGSTAAQTGTAYWAPAGTIGAAFSLRSNGFTRTGYSFNKWAMGSTSGTQYAAGASITLTANTTFYALWTDNAWTWVNDYVGSGAGLTISITEARNCASLSSGDTLSRFDIHSYHDDDSNWMAINFQTNRVNTKGCKYMTLTFPDFFMGRNNDGNSADYVRVVSNTGAVLKEWKDRVYGGSQKIDVSSASEVYIIGCIGAWGQSQSPTARVQGISFSNS